MLVNKEIVDQYEATIGIECHVQLATKTKLFSGADNDAREAAPNTKVSPICFGLPGVLPVLNKEAITLAIRAGIALSAELNEISSFDRKHYFYPDLPLGYQITQAERPTIGPGVVEVPFEETSFEVRIHHAHLEADAGKLTHPQGASYSLVDLNRAGTPLIEVVSEPDMHSPAEAKAFAQELHLRMTYAGVTAGNLYYGNMRFDVNVSVTKRGASELGMRTETKNLNSFRSVEKAVAYEIRRQIEELEKGNKIIQETRGWEDAKQRTFSQRSKENAHDYRYFPEADIPPIVLNQATIETIRLELMPQLPPAIRERLKEKGIPTKDISTLFLYPLLLNRLLQLEEETDKKSFKQISDLLINVLPAAFEKLEPETYGKTSAALPYATALKELIGLVNDSKISSSSAKTILLECWQTLKSPQTEAESRGLIQESNEDAIAAIVEEVLADPASEKAVDKIKAGNDKAIGYLVGQVMKRSEGKANPALAQQLIRKKLHVKFYVS